MRFTRELAAPQGIPATGRPLAAHLLADVPVYAAGLGLLMISIAMLTPQGVVIEPKAIAMNAQLHFAAGFAMLIVDVIHLLMRARPDRPIAFLAATYRTRLADPRIAVSLIGLALAIVYMPFFSKLKSMIPLVAGFGWDPTFIAWDRALLGGRDAWTVLQPALGFPRVTALLALLYHLWILLIYAGGIYFMFYRAASPVRRQYMLGFFLIWTVIGGGLATLFASVGPCFVGPILGNPTFDGQMAYLRSANEVVPVMTLHVQELLLGWHQTGGRGLGSGISAMPSMHVALSALFWLAIRQISSRAGWAFFAFMLAIWIGSVHLAYHYAVDGLVALLATAILWHAAQLLIAWWDRAGPVRLHSPLRTNTDPTE